MNNDLRRIADALEEIASMMRSKTAKQPAPIDVQRDELLQLMKENAGKLIGKMEMPGIAEAIGVHMVPSKRRVMGAALKAYGAVRGMSGNKGYYLFPGTERVARTTGKNNSREVLRLEAFRAALADSLPALSGSMTAKQVITSLGYKRMPGDEVALSAALEAEGVQHIVRDDIFIF